MTTSDESHPFWDALNPDKAPPMDKEDQQIIDSMTLEEQAWERGETLPTSPAAMEMLRESHAAALNHALDVGQRYLRGEATAEEVTQSGRDLDMTSDLLYRGEHPEKEGAE